MQYLTEERYKALGGELDGTAFTLSEMLAQREVDSYTFNRIKAEFDGTQDYTDELELLIFYLIEHPVERENVISSESTDGVAVSYKISDSKDIIIQRGKMIKNMLFGYTNSEGVPLMYKGACFN